MKEIVKDLFECIDDGADAICITTNGMYDHNKEALMGGGCAGVCARRWPQTANLLGKHLYDNVLNVPYVIGALRNNFNQWENPLTQFIDQKLYKCLIFSYPTIDDLRYGSNIELIERSSILLKEYADKLDLKNIVTVRPGSGIGGLSYYEDVRPVISKIFDDRFTIVCQENDEFRTIV